MEYATIQLKVPKEMQVYFTDDYAFESNEELKRNALLLYQTFRAVKKEMA